MNRFCVLGLLVVIVGGRPVEESGNHWRVHKDRMDKWQSCELAGEVEGFPDWVFSVKTELDTQGGMGVELRQITVSPEPRRRTSALTFVLSQVPESMSCHMVMLAFAKVMANSNRARIATMTRLTAMSILTGTTPLNRNIKNARQCPSASFPFESDYLVEQTPLTTLVHCPAINAAIKVYSGRTACLRDADKEGVEIVCNHMDRFERALTGALAEGAAKAR